MHESDRGTRSQIEKGKLSKEERDRETGKAKKRWGAAATVNEKKNAKRQEVIACRIRRIASTDRRPPREPKATARVWEGAEGGSGCRTCSRHGGGAAAAGRARKRE
jgi:hypothetical protein